MCLALHSRPKIVGIEEARELRIEVDDVDVALAAVADDSFGEVARLVGFNINAQGAVDFQTEPVTVSKDHADFMWKK